MATRTKPAIDAVEILHRLLAAGDSGGRTGLFRVQDSKDYCLCRAGDLDRLGLIAGKHLGGLTGIPNIDTKRSQPFCAVQGVRRLTIRAAHKSQQPVDLVSLGKLDLVEGQKNLQILLDGLLAMKTDDLAKAGAARHTGSQFLGGFQIGFRLLDPLAQQGLETRIKRLHK